MEHSVNIQGTFSKSLVNLQWTFSERKAFRLGKSWLGSQLGRGGR
jgi:hypothetical protein